MCVRWKIRWSLFGDYKPIRICALVRLIGLLLVASTRSDWAIKMLKSADVRRVFFFSFLHVWPNFSSSWTVVFKSFGCCKTLDLSTIISDQIRQRLNFISSVLTNVANDLCVNLDRREKLTTWTNNRIKSQIALRFRAVFLALFKWRDCVCIFYL